MCRQDQALLTRLARPRREEIERARNGTPASWAGHSAHQPLFLAAAELVRLATAERGLLLTIDDVHDADDGSLRLLHYLARPARGQRVCIVLAHRHDDVLCSLWRLMTPQHYGPSLPRTFPAPPGPGKAREDGDHDRGHVDGVVVPDRAGARRWARYRRRARRGPGAMAPGGSPSPQTGGATRVMSSGGAGLVDRAVTEARRAYPAWRDTPPRERGRLLRLVAAKIRAHAEELAELEAREVGKPVRDALRVDAPAGGLRLLRGHRRDAHGEILDQGPIEARVVYEPYGVVAAILPFNWPPIHFSKKCAPALVAGNTVVIKPGEQAPLTVLRLVE